MKRIVVFGAGKSSTCLIDYLIKTCSERNWSLTVGDAHLRQDKPEASPTLQWLQIQVENAEQRKTLIRSADLVISLLPPSLHILIARDCLVHEKNLLTASYVDEEIRKLSKELKDKKLLFLCEMGLDPGIDHMSAMQIIHQIQDRGGKITLFRSHTGGLVAPDSDDNAWHYKISWNPANVVKAGSAGAQFLESGKIKQVTYRDLFENTGEVQIEPMGSFAWYPNRDSLAYIPVYGLESAQSFIRTTLRHPSFCLGWKNLVRSGLTNDDMPVSTQVHTLAEWSKPLLPFLNSSNRVLYEQLGLFSEEPLPSGAGTSAKILQAVLENKWKMRESDRDMILMLHELEFELDDQKQGLRSSLVVLGENNTRTAMAKTVGLPLGIAAKLILENKISLTGLHIPIIKEIYEPVLEALKQEGIRFREQVN
jgi:saccharopine dehydrogenase-like NADP-dependent oxidoreductase